MFFRSGLLLTFGKVFSYSLSLARNVILARALSKADFGLVAIFSMAISLLEFAGRASFGQQVIQSKEGDSTEFIAASHSFQFVLAFASAILMVVLSPIFAAAFHVKNLWWAFASIAMVPLARGFENLDIYRQQRTFKYLPSVLCDVIPQLVITAMAWPLAKFFNDFRAIIVIIAAKAFLSILMTHILSKERFRWSWNRALFRHLWNFGWPLIINGFVIFGSQQADQAIVGSFLSLSDLASYALAASLVGIPWFIFAQVSGSLVLPHLAKVQDNLDHFRQSYRSSVNYAAIAAVALMAPLIVAGEPVVVTLYGAKYRGTGPVIAIFACALAIRFVRFTPAVAALARGDTINELFSNLWRSAGLVFVVVAVKAGYGMLAIAACGVLGEAVAALGCLVRLRKRQSVPLSDTIPSFIFIAVFIAAASLLNGAGIANSTLIQALAASTFFVAVSLVIASLIFRGFRSDLGQLVKHRPAFLRSDAAVSRS